MTSQQLDLFGAIAPSTAPEDDRTTAISWTNHTWNPAHGCSRVSEGCRNCYAERLSLKNGWTKKPWTGPNAAENVTLKPHKLRDPYKIKGSARVFVNSMSDLFHEMIPDDYLSQVFQVMADNPHLTFQVLTKRPKRAALWTWWPDNVWMGTSIEDARVIHRLDDLRPCGAAVLFVSAEPLIGPWPAHADLTGFHWVIVGGESGEGRRPMPHAWARGIRDLCQKQAVAYFFKQSSAYRTELGTSLRHEDGTFWRWAQYPGVFTEPEPAEAHKYHCE